jgi:hypothetical protein
MVHKFASYVLKLVEEAVTVQEKQADVGIAEAYFPACGRYTSQSEDRMPLRNVGVNFWLLADVDTTYLSTGFL